MKYSVKSVITIVLIVLSTIGIDTVWKINLESSIRTQAHYNLNQIKLCLNNELLKSKIDGMYTKYGIKTRKQIADALYVCAEKSKLSAQGDVWAYDLHTKEYVFDSNPKYGKPEGRYWDKRICNKQGSWCPELIKHMNSGNDSKGRESWKFQDDTEWLEWMVMPDVNSGYNGVTRTNSKTPQQIVVIQGARKSELMHRYRFFRMFLYTLGFVMIIINLLLEVVAQRSRDV